MSRLQQGPVLLLVLALFGTVVGCRPEAKVEPEAGQAQRVIVIGIDTLRSDRLSGYGYGRPTSPVIDRLAEEEGVRLRMAAHMLAVQRVAAADSLRGIYA